MTRSGRPSPTEVENVCKGVSRAGLLIRKVVVSHGQFEVLISNESNEAGDESDVDRLDREALEKKLYAKK